MSWGKIYCDTNWGENKYRTAGSIINEATPDCFQFPEFVTFKDHVRSEGATYEKMQCGIDILLFLGRSISITPKSPDNPTFSGILDTYTGATAGYSTRRLTNTYTGGLIRVRRSSDDAEQDIGYDANGEDMDIFGLLAFVNSGEVFTNPDITSATGWTLGSNTTYNASTEAFDLVAENGLAVRQGKNVNGHTFAITIVLDSVTSGGIKIYAGGTQSAVISTAGTHTLNIVGGSSNDFLGVNPNGTATCSISSFSAIDTTADGHITTWYDQTGNGNHATNSTASEQPLIVDGGSIIYEGATISRPAIQFDGVDDDLTNSFAASISQPTYWFVTHNFHSTPAAFDGVSGNITGDSEHRVFLNGSLSYSLQAGGYIAYNSYQTNQSLITYKIDSADERFYLNGTEQTSSGGSGIGSGVLESIVLGSLSETFGHSPIQYQEIILFDSDKSTNRTGIEGNIDNYFRIIP